MAPTDLDRSSSTSSHQPVLQKPLPTESWSAGQVSGEVARIERRLSHAPDRSDSISSWISDQSQTLPNPNLPLTPPALSLGSNSNRDSLIDPQAEERTLSTPDTAVRQVPSTPSLQRSPPTPDHTPPKVARQPSDALKPGSPGSRKPSSTAGSFRTAQEQFSVDNLPESNASFHTPETLARSQVTLDNSAVGLGLGFESPDGSRTPTMRSPRIVGDTADMEPWLDHSARIDDDPLTVPESLAVREIEQERKLENGLLHPAVLRTPTQDPAPGDLQAALEVVSSARSPMSLNRQASTSPVEQLSRPTSNDSDFIHVDKKRLSGISNQSQVVQAIVLSTPKKRRQWLRHSSKNESLRSASSPVPTSNRSSLTSSESKPRPLHRAPKMIEWPNRASLNSDSGISMGSDTRPKVDDSVGWHDIPGLRSSLRRSSERERTLARKYSDLARRHSNRRPSTAPETEKVKSSPRSVQRRSNSLVNTGHLAPDSRGRRTADYPPVIPPRSSSLSAHTSQHNSRSASLTSTSLHKHNVQQQQHLNLKGPAQAPKSPRTMQISRTMALPEIRLGPVLPKDEEERPSKEDALSLQRRSLMTTPFSGVSVPTSTPGPIEVNEATVVNIYPHSNTSVLVVQQFPQQGSDRPRLLTSRSGNVSIKLEDGQSPSSNSNVLAPTSKLLTRKQPPSFPLIPAPAVMLIPPTPSQAGDQTVSRSSSKKYPPTSSKVSMVRRALSTRRYSESLVTPLTRSIVVGRQNLQETSRAPKLSPLWRPRAFWNDIPDPDSDIEDHDYYVRNTLGLPQVRLMTGPGSLSRRIGSLRRRKLQQQAEQDAAARADLDGAERRVGILARLKHTKIVPFASLAEAIEKLRARRTETQLEKHRDRLRKHIGPPMLAPNDSHNL